MLALVNLNEKLTYLPEFSFQFYYTLQGVFPSWIRDFIYSKKDYGLLVNPAYNVSSFFDPIIRDFGTEFSFLIMPFFYFFILYIYFKAKSGHTLYFFIFPAIFASSLLSFFSMYFTMLVVLLYPIPAYLFLRKYKVLFPIAAKDIKSQLKEKRVV